MLKSLYLPFCLCIALVATGCSTLKTTESGTVGVTRSQTVSPLIDRDDLNKQAKMQYAQTLKEADNKDILNTDNAMTRRVRTISNRIIAQTPVFRSDAKNWAWEVNVIKSKEVNAWCMPGGKIAVYSGIIEQLKLTDDELAAIIGHEIAHALREHGLEKASESANASVGIGILGGVVGVLAGGSTGSLTTDAASGIYQLSMGLPNSRTMETEADRIGIELSARAGYDPQGAVTLWRKMGAAAKSAPPSFLSTHPASEDREADLQNYAKIVEPLYEKARQGK